MTLERARRAATRAQRQPDSAKRQLTISIIGAGRLGTALALALSRRGYVIEALVARRAASARRAATLLNSNALSLSLKQLGQLPPSDLLFITTPDDAIAGVAAQLAATLRERVQRRRVVLHASGALSSDVLGELSGAGFSVGSLHPLVSVSEPATGALNLSTAFFCLEGERAAVRVARSLVRALGARSFSIKARDKALYHAAAVMASGHTVALFDIAASLLARCGLTERSARAVLLPLVRSTIENLAVREPSRALTGTFSRADLATMQRHLAAVRSRGGAEALAAYILLGQHSLKLAERSGADKQALREMARALKKS